MTEAHRPPLFGEWLLLASFAVGLIYPLLWDMELGAVALLGLKGAAVGLLALLAAKRARGTDDWLLAATMGLAAIGDILLEIRFEIGAVAFAAGHVVAITLYLRNQRSRITPSQRAVAWLLPVFGLAMPLLLLGSDPRIVGLSIYSLLLTLMASTAWTSRFPRYRTGLGAMLFVASDILIAARMGPLTDVPIVNPSIWLLYYFGQLLIFIGVSSTLRSDRAQAIASSTVAS